MTYANQTPLCGNSGLLDLIAHYGNGTFNLPFTSNNTFNVTAAYNAYAGQGMPPPFKVGFSYTYQANGCNLVVSDTLILEECVGVGKIVLEENVTVNNQTISLDYSSLAAGVHFVEVS
jgi:hypothetical protein